VVEEGVRVMTRRQTRIVVAALVIVALLVVIALTADGDFPQVPEMVGA
jgi:hypothetical protein